MISVSEAESIILASAKSYGTEKIAFNQTNGRVLAEDIIADRDLPPCDRSTMDGIAIKYTDYESGQREFRIIAILAAGSPPPAVNRHNECIQIMTGAAIPDSFDTVIPIEDTAIKNQIATINSDHVIKGQFIHPKGKDSLSGAILVKSNQIITSSIIPVAASVGKTQLSVTKAPRTVVITTGDELVDITDTPLAYQVRRSNSYGVQAALTPYKADILHVNDNPVQLKKQLAKCLDEYDVLIISGGVSKGEYDYIPGILKTLSVEILFHGVKQKPGKPFLFGQKPDGTVVFALPGNPVSTFLCMYRYVLPWFKASMSLATTPDMYAILDQDVKFTPALDYFLQVKLTLTPTAKLLATPIAHNGSGDYVSLIGADAFIQLSSDMSVYKRGEIYKIIPIRSIL